MLPVKPKSESMHDYVHASLTTGAKFKREHGSPDICEPVPVSTSASHKLAFLQAALGNDVHSHMLWHQSHVVVQACCLEQTDCMKESYCEPASTTN